MGARGRWIAAGAVLVLLAVALLSIPSGPDGQDDTPPPELPDEPGPSAPGLPGNPPAPSPEKPAAGEAADSPHPPSATGPGVIHGEVVDAEGRPVPAAEVEVRPTGPGGALLGTLFLRGAKLPGAVTDTRGRFRVVDLKEGDHAVTARAAGYVAESLMARPGGGPVRIVLGKGHEISGTAFDQATGDPAAGIVIDVRRADAPKSKPVVQATAGKDGRFTVAGLRAGAYLLGVGSWAQLAPGPTREYVPTSEGPVEAGARDVPLPLTRGLPISGRIEDDQGAPLEAQVTIEIVGLNRDGDPDPARRRVAWSSPDGSFRLAGLQVGDYRLTFEPHPGSKLSAALTVVPRVAAGTEDLRVRMGSGAAIEGRLEDENGDPVVSVGAIFVYPTGSHPARGGATALPVNADGTFRTVPLDPEQRYDILATGFPGHDAGHVKGVAPGSPKVVVLLRLAFRITGKVLDEDGKPVPVGVGVVAIAPDASPDEPGRRSTAFTAAGGTFALEGLRDRAYRLRAGGGKGSAFRSGDAVPDIRPNAADPVVLRVRRGVTFSGRLVDGEGRAVKTNVTAHQDDDAVPPWAPVRDEEGNFTLTGLAPGKLTLHAYVNREYVNLGEFTAPAAGVEIVVPPR